MDEASLLRLAEDGLAPFPPSSLPDLAQWCRDRTASTGDGRWSVVAECLTRISQPFEEDGQLSTAVLEALDRVLSVWLPDVVHAASAEAGALLASSMREALEEVTVHTAPLIELAVKAEG